MLDIKHSPSLLFKKKNNPDRFFSYLLNKRITTVTVTRVLKLKYLDKSKTKTVIQCSSQ